MEENRNDPFQFIGFLLISIILMFWFYSSRNIPEIVENDIEVIEKTISEDEILIDNNSEEINEDGEFNFEQKKLILENDKIYMEIDSKGANITLLHLKEFTNYNKDSLMLVDSNNSSFNISIPNNFNRIINSKDIIFDSDIIERNKKIKLTGYISDNDFIEITYNLDSDSYMLDYQLKLNGFETYSNQNDFFISWAKDSFRNSKSIDYENRYTALSYGFENNQSKSVMIIAARGCPFPCTFCDRTVLGKGYRANSIEYLDKMLTFLNKNYGYADFDIKSQSEESGTLR